LSVLIPTIKLPSDQSLKNRRAPSNQPEPVD
jgi:hypothetical protein